MSGIAIIGIGEVPTALLPERTHWDIIYDTCIEAITDSGLGKDELQGTISVVPVGQPLIAGELAFGLLPERLGLKGVRDSALVNAGGASTSNALRLAERLISDIGLRPVSLGDSDQADLVDSITALWFALAIRRQHGRHLAFKVLGM